MLRDKHAQVSEDVIAEDAGVTLRNTVPPSFHRALADVDLDPSHPLETQSNRPVSIISSNTVGGMFVGRREQLARTPIVAKIEIESASGDRFVFDYIEFHLVPTRGTQLIWSNKDQAILTEITLSMNLTEKTATLNFRQKREPTNADEFAEALRLQTCFSQPGVVRVIERSTGLVMPKIEIEQGVMPPPDPNWVALIEDLDTIQKRLHRPIRIQGGQRLTAEESESIAKLRTILNKGGFTATWQQFTLNMLVPGVRLILEKFGGGLVDEIRLERDEVEELFGVPLPLGRARYTWQARLANESEIRAHLAEAKDDSDSIVVEFVPVDDLPLRVEYLDWQLPTARIGPETEYPIGLNEAQLKRLKDKAAQLGISTVELVGIGITDLLNEPDEDFMRDVDYVLAENAELYRRLA